ncbi:MAG: hypothetical protein QOG85_1153 [Gaiellaceae bacterium]|jgi:hypothetical protein|nr:hypothetical protein [Gaiellaceae bacterium]
MAGLLLALLVLVATQAAAAPYPADCLHRDPDRDYRWPVKPFARQHPIRGAFGDPRTLGANEQFGRTGPHMSGSYSFHSGIDIVAPDGTAVYPVVSGWIVSAQGGKVVVHTPDGTSFQYDHVVPAVRVGEFATAELTVIGRVQARRGHVHLTEIDRVLQGTRCISFGANPLAPGHLEPYRDETRPTADGLYVDSGSGPSPLARRSVAPGDQVSVSASDPPALPVPGTYAGLPQTPAFVEWSLSQGNASRVWHMVADFRRTEPGTEHFWQVYAPGTYQNQPEFDHRLYVAQPGRYLFPVDLRPGRLRPGSYRIVVRVADVRGNTSTTAFPIRIAR